MFLKPKRKPLKSRKPNANHVFEIFGKFSHENADVVRASIVDYITCDPVSFKERMVVVLTMLHLNLDEWLMRIKDPRSPADEGVVYGLCQLYSQHALAYTTGSVWSTLEIHRKCSLQDVKRHCDIHLVFLEGGVLGHLHKKPSIPKLMSVSCPTFTNVNQPSHGETIVNTDHTYSSPTPLTKPSVLTSNIHNDHTYAEDSDVNTEPYGSDSDGKTNCTRSGTSAEGCLVIASTDKLVISIECSQASTLLEETGTSQNASEMLLDASDAGLIQPRRDATDSSFKERMVVVLTMLHLNLDEWLMRIKDPRSPADEGVVYGLCQLYSQHALAYTTGSVWSTLEIHRKCSLQDVKRHCDIHLVFLEGGVLGHLHKKPSIPKLMSVSCPTFTNVNQPSHGETIVNTDHTYSSPTPLTKPSVLTSNIHNDHTYAEDSDVNTEPYGSDSDGKTNCTRSGTSAEGCLVIASTDKLVISIECSQASTLLEETGTSQNASEMLLDASDAGLIQPRRDATDSRSTSPDETQDNKVLLELSSKMMLSRTQSVCLDETKDTGKLLDATIASNTEQMSTDATMCIPPTELDATKNDQTMLLEATNEQIVLPEATSGPAPQAQIETIIASKACSNIQTRTVASPDTVVDDADMNESYQKPTVSESESRNEALVYGTMQVADQLNNGSCEQPGETVKTWTSVDQNMETHSSESVSPDLNSSTREHIIGEISYSDKSDADHWDVSSENLVSNFKPLETSSVVSELTEFSQTPETNDCMSSTADSPSHQSTTWENVDNVLMNSTTSGSSVCSAVKHA